MLRMHNTYEGYKTGEKLPFYFVSRALSASGHVPGGKPCKCTGHRQSQKMLGNKLPINRLPGEKCGTHLNVRTLRKCMGESELATVSPLILRHHAHVSECVPSET